MSDDVFVSFLNKTAILYRPTIATTPNSFGERRTEPGAILVSELDISLQPLREKLEIDIGGMKYLLDLVAYMLPTDILDGDILEVDSKKYRVVGVEDEGGEYHHYKVFLTREN